MNPWPVLNTRPPGAVPVGALMAFAGQVGGSSQTQDDAPKILLEAQGWMLCDGRALEAARYPDLFAVIGYLYGGDQGTFRIPDHRGYFWRGADGGADVDPDAAHRAPARPGGPPQGVGSTQSFAVQNHEHAYGYALDAQATDPQGKASGAQSNQTKLTTGGPVKGQSKDPDVKVSPNETRPINVYVNYIIKWSAV